MLEFSDVQFACNDARVRNAAIVDLIHQGDRHALALLQFYIAVASAAISAAAAIFVTAAPIPKSLCMGTDRDRRSVGRRRLLLLWQHVGRRYPSAGPIG